MKCDEIFKRIYRSFPNGSAYYAEELRSTQDFEVSGSMIINRKTNQIFRLQSSERIGVGGGTDFGIHFCTQDQLYKSHEIVLDEKARIGKYKTGINKGKERMEHLMGGFREYGGSERWVWFDNSKGFTVFIDVETQQALNR